jgi:hypothetical protein
LYGPAAADGIARDGVIIRITPVVVIRRPRRVAMLDVRGVAAFDPGRRGAMTPSYEIRVKGRLGPEMLHLLADLAPEVGAHSTVLHTAGIDQPSLHGTLNRVGNLGLEIDSVEKVERSG